MIILSPNPGGHDYALQDWDKVICLPGKHNVVSSCPLHSYPVWRSCEPHGHPDLTTPSDAGIEPVWIGGRGIMKHCLSLHTQLHMSIADIKSQHWLHIAAKGAVTVNIDSIITSPGLETPTPYVQARAGTPCKNLLHSNPGTFCIATNFLALFHGEQGLLGTSVAGKGEW